MKNCRISRKLIAILITLALLAAVAAIGAMAAETAPATGYAAVGIVDAEAHKAEVLLGTGEQGTVYFNGNAPASGAVYSYTRDANNLYTFATPNANNGNSNQLADTGWNYWHTPNGWMWNALGQIFFPNSSPIFIRFGNDGWALGAISSFVETNGAGWIYGYMLDAFQTDAANNYWAVGAIVLGGYNNGSIDTTGFDTSFPSITATNSLAAFTTSLHANVNTDAIAVESGYAAVGYVDTANSQVEILKDNGEQGYVTYIGTAPVTGGVYRYGRNAKNAYTFTEPVANHGNSSLTDASKPFWWMWMNTEYDGYMWDSSPNHYWPTATTPIFLRTSLTNWMVTTEACFTANTQVAAYQLDVSIQAGSSSYYDTQAIVFGGLNADGTIDTTGFDALNLPQTSHDLGALTQPLHPVSVDPTDPPVDPTDPPVDPTDPPVDPTDPPVEEKPGASGNVVENGYAAIGAVDAEACKAEVLLGNGLRGTVKFTGTAPKTGAVYGYALHSNNVYVFTEKIGNFGNSDQLVPGTAWNIWFTPQGWAWDANQPNDIFHVPTPTPIFLHYGNGQWAVITIDKVNETNGGAWAYGYALDTVHLPDMDAGNGLTNFATGALVMGNPKADGTTDTTGFPELFGDVAKVDLSSFSAPLVNPNAPTGDASGIVSTVAALLFAASGVVFLASKKKQF
ncbi:MAG: LPXTG cell wall anchor domain-containing protein [Oscillospiraceae bacterium]|nr:LPXTG cell wall anchor domain-containing protein [Oscillospiraceae bacterium]